MREVRRGDQQASTAIPGDVLDFSHVEAGIDRYCAAVCHPASKHYFKKLGAILHTQNDPVARLETARCEAGGEAGNAADEFAVTPAVSVVGDRRRLRLTAGDIE
jgi:hypothetical protein